MPVGRTKSFFDQYTSDLKTADLERLFTSDTAEAYRFFTRNVDTTRLDAAPWYRRWPQQLRLVVHAFSMRLSPARRALYGVSMATSLLGLILLFRGFDRVGLLIFPFTVRLPLPAWVDGTWWLVLGVIGLNLLILMEVADRLSLKGDLEIARDIQLAMLPDGMHHAGDATVCGVTRPANTVGGDFYDILPLPDGRLVLALGDVAGKGSPAALLMALLLAMLRTLVDEGLDTARLIERLNAQVMRHSPRSRFITLFFGIYDPQSGRLEFVNAGHLPPLLHRADGSFERVGSPDGSGLALGMFEQATYATNQVTIAPGDLVVLFSDGITEAENSAGIAFDETGLETVVSTSASDDPQALGRMIFRAVEAHAGKLRLADDLTALVLKRTA